jgi:Tol biopolymer transport system component
MRIKISMLLAVGLGLCAPAPATWTTPAPLTEVNIQPGEDWAPFLAFDGLSLYFARVDTPTSYHGRIYQATRDVPSGPFTSVREISELNRPANHVLAPWVSPDNLRMYYHTEEATGWYIRASERASVDSPWPQGVVLSELNALGNYIQVPRLTPDELTIFFHGSDIPDRVGQHDIWMATRPEKNAPFGDLTNLAGVNSAFHDVQPFVSPDGLELYFSSDRNGAFQLFRATRDSTASLFGGVEHLSFFDVPGGHSNFPCLSSDGMAFYFTGQPGGRSTRDIYVSYIPEPATLVLLGLGAVMLFQPATVGRRPRLLSRHTQ